MKGPLRPAYRHAPLRPLLAALILMTAAGCVGDADPPSRVPGDDTPPRNVHSPFCVTLASWKQDGLFEALAQFGNESAFEYREDLHEPSLPHPDTEVAPSWRLESVQMVWPEPDAQGHARFHLRMHDDRPRITFDALYARPVDVRGDFLRFTDATTIASEHTRERWFEAFNASYNETPEHVLDEGPLQGYAQRDYHRVRLNESDLRVPALWQDLHEVAPPTREHDDGALSGLRVWSWTLDDDTTWVWTFAVPVRAVVLETGSAPLGVLAKADGSIILSSADTGGTPAGLQAWVREAFADVDLPEPEFAEWERQRRAC